MKSVRIIIERSVKRKSCACVASKVYKELTCVFFFLMFYSESERAIERYDEWLRLREQAIQNWESTHPSLPLPERLQEPPPPRPEPYEDEPMVDVSVEMTADGFDPGESFTLDRSIGEEMVPVADPEVDKVLPISVSRGFFRSCRFFRLFTWLIVFLANVVVNANPGTRTGSSKSDTKWRWRRWDCIAIEEKISVAD